MIFLALSLTAAAAPRCEVDTLTEVRDVLVSIDLERRSELAAQAISEACKLPKDATKTLSSFAMVGPAHSGTLDRQLVVNTPDDWAAACAGGVGMVVDLMNVPVTQHRSFLWTKCEGSTRDWMDEGSWSAASGLLFAPVLARHWLREAGVPDEVARAYVRALAGVEDERVIAKDAAIVREFEPLYP